MSHGPVARCVWSSSHVRQIPDQPLSDQDLHASSTASSTAAATAAVVRHLADRPPPPPTGSTAFSVSTASSPRCASICRRGGRRRRADRRARPAARRHRAPPPAGAAGLDRLQRPAGRPGRLELVDPPGRGRRAPAGRSCSTPGRRCCSARDPFEGAQLPSGRIGAKAWCSTSTSPLTRSVGPIRRPWPRLHRRQTLKRARRRRSGSSTGIGDPAGVPVRGHGGSDADVALTLVPEGHVSLHWRRGPLGVRADRSQDSEQLLRADASDQRAFGAGADQAAGAAGDRRRGARRPWHRSRRWPPPWPCPSPPPRSRPQHRSRPRRWASIPSDAATPLPAAHRRRTRRPPKSL